MNERVVRPVVLCGNQLPWVKSCKHLVTTIVSAAGTLGTRMSRIRELLSLTKTMTLFKNLALLTQRPEQKLIE